MPDKALDLGIKDTEHLGVLRAGLSTWLTLALDSAMNGVSDADLHALRDWVDGGCAGVMPEPVGLPEPTLADRTKVSMQVYWETKDWSAARFRTALTEERMRVR